MFWYFILGVLTASYIFPILDKVGELILTYLEMLKGKVTVKITQLQAQISKIQNNEKETPVKIVGFVASEDENEDV